MELVRASADVIGKNIENPAGESLGEIEDIMLDKIDGTVEYVVVSFGGFLGLGEKLFAMPWSIFNYNTERECFVITVDKEKLENAPGFDRDHWPDISSPTWSSSINSYYGTRPHHS